MANISCDEKFLINDVTLKVFQSNVCETELKNKFEKFISGYMPTQNVVYYMLKNNLLTIDLFRKIFTELSKINSIHVFQCLETEISILLTYSFYVLFDSKDSLCNIINIIANTKNINLFLNKIISIITNHTKINTSEKKELLFFVAKKMLDNNIFIIINKLIYDVPGTTRFELIACISKEILITIKNFKTMIPKINSENYKVIIDVFIIFLESGYDQHKLYNLFSKIPTITLRLEETLEIIKFFLSKDCTVEDIFMA